MHSGLREEVAGAGHSWCFDIFFFLKDQCCEKALGKFRAEREQIHFARFLCASNKMLSINVLI